MKTGDWALLNLGCGSRFHPQWTNIDLIPLAVQVQAHDLRQPLPFPDCHFDVVYHSNVLEHFHRDQGLHFLRHCHRVLKPDGIIRVAVPDLEEIVRLYKDGSHSFWILIRMAASINLNLFIAKPSSSADLCH